jgi:hypothetical protein
VKIYVENIKDKKMKQVKRNARMVVESKNGASLQVDSYTGSGKYLEEREGEQLQFIIKGKMYTFESFEELAEVIEGSKQAKII